MLLGLSNRVFQVPLTAFEYDAKFQGSKSKAKSITMETVRAKDLPVRNHPSRSSFKEQAFQYRAVECPNTWLTPSFVELGKTNQITDRRYGALVHGVPSVAFGPTFT